MPATVQAYIVTVLFVWPGELWNSTLDDATEVLSRGSVIRAGGASTARNGLMLRSRAFLDFEVRTQFRVASPCRQFGYRVHL